MSSGNTMRIQYQHWSEYPGYPAFKLHYYFVDEEIWSDKPTGKKGEVWRKMGSSEGRDYLLYTYLATKLCPKKD